MDPAAPSWLRLERPLRAADAWALIGALLVLALAWRLADVLLLAFAGLLLALLLVALAEPLRRWLPQRAALALVVVGLSTLLGIGAWLAGEGLADQASALGDKVPQAVEAARRWLNGYQAGRWFLHLLTNASRAPQDLGALAGFATLTVNATLGLLGGLVLVVALGIYLAGDTALYRRGLLRLLPAPCRDGADELMSAVAAQLLRWLRGQAVSMSAIGLFTALGLSVIGVPQALVLGLVAGLLDFMPYFGPVISGLLIVAIALTESEQIALGALLVCIAVQQAEAYLVQPLVQRWAVRMPPVLGLVAVLVFGLLFGLAGALLAVPLMVVLMTVVEHGLVCRDRP